MPRNTGHRLHPLRDSAVIWMFALVWWIWWLAALMTVAMILAFILWTFDTSTEDHRSPQKRCAKSMRPGWRWSTAKPAVDRDHEDRAGKPRPRPP